jgi:NAD(P)-dependent dehydrogenase (short-subunit alcohol dehydrogenase family)
MPSSTSNKQLFSDKVVIVTGFSSGIGQAAAVMFGREGASVVIHGQDAARLQKTHDLMTAEGVDPSHILQVIASMEAEDTPKSILTATLAKFQRINVLVNNAGAAMKPGSKAPNALENLDFLYRVNFRSVVELTQLCLPELVKTKGCVVNISSIGSTRPHPQNTFYASLKAALDHFTRNYAVLYGPKGVRINSLK